ncbi:hypothetical protein PC113_g6031 [Phytophthora cactorum]|uniref:Uncharacterized protein n=1 Tax=Phytophthora cactorum TaxID=29920 RepID=A0A8T0ZKI2_9STRA|nr:hypothetical protein PC113_g6031 [Phytophthora cactorum]KAG3183824.1 hypothetical protein C6341_g5310 [Phytophthora cactorum]
MEKSRWRIERVVLVITVNVNAHTSDAMESPWPIVRSSTPRAPIEQITPVHRGFLGASPMIRALAKPDRCRSRSRWTGDPPDKSRLSGESASPKICAERRAQFPVCLKGALKVAAIGRCDVPCSMHEAMTSGMV